MLISDSTPFFFIIGLSKIFGHSKDISLEIAKIIIEIDGIF